MSTIWENIKKLFSRRRPPPVEPPAKPRWAKPADKYLSDGTNKPYVSRYSLRSELEQSALRSFLKIDPKKCDHLKGGFGKRVGRLDYNVSLFTFATGVQRIRCNSCGKKWFKGKPGWADAVQMLECSSNCPASSEIPADVLNGKLNRNQQP